MSDCGASGEILLPHKKKKEEEIVLERLICDCAGRKDILYINRAFFSLYDPLQIQATTDVRATSSGCAQRSEKATGVMSRFTDNKLDDEGVETCLSTYSRQGADISGTCGAFIRAKSI